MQHAATDLAAAGDVLRIREPDWLEHRLLKGPDSDVDLHVLSAACTEPERLPLFRDWLRGNDGERMRYERTERALAAWRWQHVQDDADAKTAVVEEILARARAARQGRRRR